METETECTDMCNTQKMFWRTTPILKVIEDK